jgi:hypothetical protein
MRAFRQLGFGLMLAVALGASSFGQASRYNETIQVELLSTVETPCLAVPLHGAHWLVSEATLTSLVESFSRPPYQAQWVPITSRRAEALLAGVDRSKRLGECAVVSAERQDWLYLVPLLLQSKKSALLDAQQRYLSHVFIRRIGGSERGYGRGDLFIVADLGSAPILALLEWVQ